ncbi:hypothetical protein D932_03100 [Enterococcus casseliflavus 14-MB-W-14]|nr:hypothetical protein D932_03100 [Enterococcus casseliflavus 14-MB-W-14]
MTAFFCYLISSKSSDTPDFLHMFKLLFLLNREVKQVSWF